MAKPKFIDDEAFRSLRSGDLERFHALIAERDSVDFTDCDLRGTVMRHAEIDKLILRGSYLRDADLRGLDLREKDLEGCSLFHAKVSGAYFPPQFSAEEIRLSVELGTRLRTMK